MARRTGIQTYSPQWLLAERIRRLILQGTVAQGGRGGGMLKKTSSLYPLVMMFAGKYSAKICWCLHGLMLPIAPG